MLLYQLPPNATFTLEQQPIQGKNPKSLWGKNTQQYFWMQSFAAYKLTDSFQTSHLGAMMF